MPLIDSQIKPMNGSQRILAALQGEPVDTTPVMLHNFMMAAHEAGVSMQQFRRDARLAAGCYIQAVEKYLYDGIFMDIDTATLAGAIGAKVDFPENEPARVSAGCLTSLQQVDDLKPVNLSADGRIQVWLEVVSRLVEHFGGEVLIRGNCDQSPFSLAALVRTTDQWLVDLTEPENGHYIQRLLEYCTECTNQFIRLMAQTGAQVVSNGDSIAGPDMISPRFYRTFALPYEQKIAAQAAALGLPYILHICGNTTRILADMATIGAQGMELDYKTDAQAAHDVFQGRVTLIGNLDPVNVLAHGTPELVRQKVEDLLRIFADTSRFILNAGCAIPPETPPENLRAMIETARRFGR